MPKWRDPNPDWPVPVRKLVNGQVETRYAHTEKELDKLTKPEEEGGFGFMQAKLTSEWPKTMSHPGMDKPDVSVANEKDQKKREKEGYSFDHWNNKQAKQTAVAIAASEGLENASFDPKARAKIDMLEQELREQKARMDRLLEKLGA